VRREAPGDSIKNTNTRHEGCKLDKRDINRVARGNKKSEEKEEINR
jgi:hypothetical protein